MQFQADELSTITPDESGIYQCTLCKYNTVVAKYFRRHLRQHEAETLSCPFCDYTSKVKYHMNRHITSHINAGTSGCPHCNFNSVRADILRSHIALHESGSPLLSCSHCTYTTLSPKELSNHNKMHSGLRMFSCSECPYTTFRKGHYNRHKNCHNKKSVTCALCEFTTSDRKKMKEHVDNHINGGEEIYSCDNCDYMTKKLSHIKRHSDIHKNVCPFCKLVVDTKQKLKDHVMLHSEARELAEAANDTSFLLMNDDSGAHSDDSEDNLVRTKSNNCSEASNSDYSRVLAKAEQEAFSDDSSDGPINGNSFLSKDSPPKNFDSLCQYISEVVSDVSVDDGSPVKTSKPIKVRIKPVLTTADSSNNDKVEKMATDSDSSVSNCKRRLDGSDYSQGGNSSKKSKLSSAQSDQLEWQAKVSIYLPCFKF